MASMIFKQGVQPSGGSYGSGSNSRPSSRNANRGAEEGAIAVKRSDSSRSALDTGTNEQKPSKNNIKVAVRVRPLRWVQAPTTSNQQAAVAASHISHRQYTQHVACEQHSRHAKHRAAEGYSQHVTASNSSGNRYSTELHMHSKCLQDNQPFQPMPSNKHPMLFSACNSDKERGRGDNAVWATDGSGGVGLTSARAPDKINIKYAYDLVFDTTTSNEQVR